MKTLYIPISILIIAFLSLGCQEELPKSHYVSVIIDHSEEESYTPSINDIQSYLTNTRLNDAVTIALSYISDTKYGSKYSFVLGEGTTGLLSNEDQRRKSIKRFYKQFKDSLGYYNSEQEPLRRSAIWSVVARELKEASKQKGNVDVLLFSDLKEHSAFSVYDAKKRKQLSRNPQVVAEELLSQGSLPTSLSNTTLHIIYTPSLEDAQIFGDMVAVYRELISSRGGNVVVGRHTKIEQL